MEYTSYFAQGVATGKARVIIDNDSAFIYFPRGVGFSERERIFNSLLNLVEAVSNDGLHGQYNENNEIHRPGGIRYDFSHDRVNPDVVKQIMDRDEIRYKHQMCDVSDDLAQQLIARR